MLAGIIFGHDNVYIDKHVLFYYVHLVQAFPGLQVVLLI
jgi:hypothetical protein